MELGTLLVKIARNENLTPQELAFLDDEGKKTQIGNNLVLDWSNQNFTSKDPTLRQLDFRTLGAKVKKSSATVVADSTFYWYVWDTIEYYDIDMVNLTSQPTRIEIPRTGRYALGVNVGFTTPSVTWSTALFVNRAYAIVADNRTVISNFTEDALLNKGDYIETRFIQFSGGNSSIAAANMYARWLGVN